MDGQTRILSLSLCFFALPLPCEAPRDAATRPREKPHERFGKRSILLHQQKPHTHPLPPFCLPKRNTPSLPPTFPPNPHKNKYKSFKIK